MMDDFPHGPKPYLLLSRTFYLDTHVLELPPLVQDMCLNEIGLCANL